MDNNVKYLIVIGGPTAVGKSALAIELARNFETEILSADSRQIYRELNVGTAKPAPDALATIKHHFVDHIPITSSFTASDFEQEGLSTLDMIYQDNDLAILCGGSGFYIHALCFGLDKLPDVHPEVRKKFDHLLVAEGIEALQSRLKKEDPKYYKVVDRENPHRLIRALSVVEQTGRAYSSYLSQKRDPRPFETIWILLDEDRQVVYEKINKRVDHMIAAGLEDEVGKLLAFRDLPALQTVGYQEWFDYFDGKIDRAEVIRLIKRNTRRYAKRQWTWFRKHGEWKSFLPSQVGEILDYIKQIKKVGPKAIEARGRFREDDR